MIQTMSHLVLASKQVEMMTKFFEQVFGIEAHFKNAEFSEFILKNGYRIAFFHPVGESAKRFSAEASREGCSFGITISDVELAYQKILSMKETFNFSLSGPPKEHPWGEKSFLLTDPDGNRWELTQSPSKDGMLIEKEFGKN